MRRTARLLVAAVLVLLPVLGARAAGAQTVGEHISDYGVGITIQPDGTLRIRESITYDFGTTRATASPATSWSASTTTGTTTAATASSSKASPRPRARRRQLQESSNGPYLHLRIGDPNQTITGVHRYQIVYTVQGGPMTFADHDELNWDAIGNQWPVADRQRARHDRGARADHARSRASRDRRAAPIPCDAPVDGRQDGDVPPAVTRRGLGPHGRRRAAEGNDPAGRRHRSWRSAGRSPTRFAVDTHDDRSGRRHRRGSACWVSCSSRRDAAATAASTGSAVDAAMGNISGAEEPTPLLDRTTGPVEFVPPDGVRPGQVGMLLDEHANLLDVTASIVDLAVRGWLTITELPPEGVFHRHSDYELTSTADKGKGTPLPYEKKLLNELFHNRDTVRLSALKYQFRASLAKVQSSMYDDSVKQGWFRIRPDRTRQRWTADRDR